MTISHKWQVVIPKEVRKKARGLKRGGKVEIKLEMGKIIITPIAERISESVYGHGREVWKDVDPVVYQRELREEWARGEEAPQNE
ncbi:MAG: AbrB/MazE/SpoVT family DNA-binding domain-containing protein [Candidatus Geothermarchaeales archaeon]